MSGIQDFFQKSQLEDLKIVNVWMPEKLRILALEFSREI